MLYNTTIIIIRYTCTRFKNIKDFTFKKNIILQAKIVINGFGVSLIWPSKSSLLSLRPCPEFSILNYDTRPVLWVFFSNAFTSFTSREFTADGSVPSHCRSLKHLLSATALATSACVRAIADRLLRFARRRHTHSGPGTGRGTYAMAYSRGPLVFPLAAVALLLLLDASTGRAHNLKDRTIVRVPGVDPSTGCVRFYPVWSPMLVLDPYRNPVARATVNGFADFAAMRPAGESAMDAHFVPIADTGHGMTVDGTGRTVQEINAEIDRIVGMLPDRVRRVTHYQRKDESRFPENNVYTGPMLLDVARPPPHQTFFRRV